MKKLLIVLLLLLVLACKQGGTSQPSTNFRTGTQGIVFNFVPNQPPSRVYDDEKFSVLLQVENRGAYDVGRLLDKIYLSGFDHRIISPENGINGQKIPNLEGRSVDKNVPTRDFVEFRMNVNPLSVTRYPFRMMATACYGYRTIMETTTCIDPNPFSISQRKKLCVPQNKNLGGQGGPVAVSSLTVEPRKGKTTYKFQVNNVGGGEVFKKEFMNLCSPYSDNELSFNELNFVQVTDIVIVGRGSIKQNCKGLVSNDYLRLQNGVGSFTCTLDTTDAKSEEFWTIRVTLDYGYRSVIFKDMELVHIP